MAQSYQVFARKYRPRTFEDVLGQDHVVQTLRNAITRERLAHAYLFVGPRGTGKTSTARILSKALNCPGGPKADFDPEDPVCIEIAEGRSLDVLEIDGASNNGVDQVRDLRETVKFAPASGQFKIYYIDEVHMLTTAAFNALLKTLEEPPAHVKFIFATTEPNKILPTILSRCQRFDLRRIPDPIIEKHLLFIAQEEGIALDPLAAHAIARGAEGGMRDAQSMLDQLVAFCGDTISEADVLQIFGFTAFETIAALTGHLLNHHAPGALEIVHRQAEGGKDLIRLMGDVISHLRNLLVAQADAGAIRAELPAEVAETVVQQAAAVSSERLLKLIDHFAEADGRMKWAPNKQLHCEIAVIKAVQTLEETTLGDVIRVLAGATEGITLEASAAAPATVARIPAAPAPEVPLPSGRAAAPQQAAEACDDQPAPASAGSAEPGRESPPSPAADSSGTSSSGDSGTATAKVAKTAKAAVAAVVAEPETGASAGGSQSEVPAAAGESKGLFSDLRETISKGANSAKSKTVDSPVANAAAPEPVPVETIADGTDGKALWQRTVEVLAEQKPLQVAWAREGAFLEFRGDALIVGFERKNAGHREQLERAAVRKSVERILSGAAGRPLSIQFEVRDTLDATKPVLPEVEEKPADTTGAGDGNAAGASPAAIDDSFYEDPAIKSALKIFGAKIKNTG